MLPRQSGRMPIGSRTAISSVGVRHSERVRAAHLRERVGDAILAGALRADGDQVDDDLGVARALEDRAARLESFAQRFGVGEVAVVGDGDRAARVVDGDRLRVLEQRAARGRVADVTDRDVAPQSLELVGRKHVDDVAHAAVQRRAECRRS